ncbi:ATP-binding protein [Streptomyces sp. NPDC051976]|uniref:sensor histidine kinase n=1 Tax=Streptomyces sp. NPDC051976 TaxID=3154947 RepID=UPI003420DBC1
MRRPRFTLRAQLTLLYAVPFLVTGAALVSVQVLQTSSTSPAYPQQGGGGPSGHPERDVQGLLTVSAAGLAVMALISLVLGWVIAGHFLRPLRTITATARDISASNLDRRLDLRRRDDEFTELAQTLDDLFARLQASFDSQRHFVANASHELRTPLTAERTLLQVALAEPDASAAALRATCEEVLALGEQQERLIDALLTLASSERGIERRETFDLAEITAKVLTDREGEARRRDIRVKSALGPAAAAGDPSLVESMVANLIDNALRHNLSGGHIDITTATVDGTSYLTMTNTGERIPPTELDRLFQPFQQFGRERIRHREGHGLGLAIVRAIADAHSATLTPHAPPEGGLRITVGFPHA